MDKMASCPGPGVSQATGAGAIPGPGAGTGARFAGGTGAKKDLALVILGWCFEGCKGGNQASASFRIASAMSCNPLATESSWPGYPWPPSAIVTASSPVGCESGPMRPVLNRWMASINALVCSLVMYFPFCGFFVVFSNIKCRFRLLHPCQFYLLPCPRPINLPQK